MKFEFVTAAILCLLTPYEAKKTPSAPIIPHQFSLTDQQIYDQKLPGILKRGSAILQEEIKKCDTRWDCLEPADSYDSLNGFLSKERFSIAEEAGTEDAANFGQERTKILGDQTVNGYFTKFSLPRTPLDPSETNEQQLAKDLFNKMLSPENTESIVGGIGTKVKTFTPKKNMDISGEVIKSFKILCHKSFYKGESFYKLEKEPVFDRFIYPLLYSEILPYYRVESNQKQEGVLVVLNNYYASKEAKKEIPIGGVMTILQKSSDGTLDMDSLNHAYFMLIHTNPHYIDSLTNISKNLWAEIISRKISIEDKKDVSDFMEKLARFAYIEIVTMRYYRGSESITKWFLEIAAMYNGLHLSLSRDVPFLLRAPFFINIGDFTEWFIYFSRIDYLD